MAGISLFISYLVFGSGFALPFLQNRSPNPGAPKAFLTYMLLDELELKLDASVQGNTAMPVITGTMQAQLLQAAGGADITITKNGYLFVFVSNESQGSVYFDDLTVTHTPGPLLEEHHYYPTGLEMFALSSSAGNGHVKNRYGYQGQERGSTVGGPPGGGLGGYEFEARHYDPQIGRWMVPDPASQFPSPYVGMGNEWVSGVDPDGRWVNIAIGATLGGISSYIKGKSIGLNGKELWNNVVTGVVVGGITAGVGISVSSSTKAIFSAHGVSNSISSIASAAVSGSAAGFTGSALGQVLSNNGKIDWSEVGKNTLFGFGGGLANGGLDILPFLSKSFPGHHLSKHVIRSTAFQMGGNLFSGNKPLEGVTFGIDETAILPGLLDMAAFTSNYWASKLAENWVSKNKENLFPSDLVSKPKYANMKVKVNHADIYLNNGGLALRLNADFEMSGLARLNLGPIKTQKQPMVFKTNFNSTITISSRYNFNYIYQSYLFNSKVWWRN